MYYESRRSDQALNCETCGKNGSGDFSAWAKKPAHPTHSVKFIAFILPDTGMGNSEWQKVQPRCDSLWNDGCLQKKKKK